MISADRIWEIQNEVMLKYHPNSRLKNIAFNDDKVFQASEEEIVQFFEDLYGNGRKVTAVD